MALTYVLIAKQILTGSQTSVTFTGIPQTFTDLLFRVNIRSDFSGNVVSPTLKYNSLGTSIYGTRYLRANNTTASSALQSGQSESYFNTGSAGSTAPAGLFAATDFYISDYTNNNYKSIAYFNGVSTSTASSHYVDTASNYIDITTGITSITIDIGAGAFNMVAGSSFYLYGIKNS